MKAVFKILISLLILSSTSSYASENQELANAYRQLGQVEQVLIRASRQAKADPYKKRAWFNYKEALQDIKTMREGINSYLNPERKQPRVITNFKEVNGNYKKVRI